MNLQHHDITSRQDIIWLMESFYSKAVIDPIIGTKFEHLKMDEHIEIIADFWDSVIFGTNTYQGDPFGKHIPLNLAPKDFSRWLELFTETVDSNFEGKNATEIKLRATTIATVFQHKLKLQE